MNCDLKHIPLSASVGYWNVCAWMPCFTAKYLSMMEILNIYFSEWGIIEHLKFFYLRIVVGNLLILNFANSLAKRTIKNFSTSKMKNHFIITLTALSHTCFSYKNVWDVLIWIHFRLMFFLLLMLLGESQRKTTWKEIYPVPSLTGQTHNDNFAAHLF